MCTNSEAADFGVICYVNSKVFFKFVGSKSCKCLPDPTGPLSLLCFLGAIASAKESIADITDASVDSKKVGNRGPYQTLISA